MSPEIFVDVLRDALFLVILMLSLCNYQNQNRSAYFSLTPGHPNALAPGKVPLHTLIASIGIRANKLWSVMGCMGADGQPQIQFQTYSAMVDHGLDIQQAVQSPGWLSGRFALGEARDTLHVESRLGEPTLAALATRPCCRAWRLSVPEWQ